MAATSRASVWARLAALVSDAGEGISWIRAQIVVVGLAIVAALAALAVGASTPARHLENVFRDLGVAFTAKPSVAPIVILKMDDAAIGAMRDSSACKCLAPIDKLWLADVIAELDAKGAGVIVVDYLLDTWRSETEEQAFEQRVGMLRAPVIAAVHPDLKAGVDYRALKNLIYADARALMKDDYDDVVRRYDPKPGERPALATAAAQAAIGVNLADGGAELPVGPFEIRYRQPLASAAAENTGSIAPAFSAALVEAIPEPFIKDKIVLIGRVSRSSSPDAETLLEDMHDTSLRFLPGHYDGTPGVEVHAHALSQMLTGDNLRTTPPWLPFAVALLAAILGALLGRTTQRMSIAVLVVALVVAAALGVYFGALLLFDTLVPVTTPALSFAFAFFLLSRLTAIKLEGERAFYSATLERYLAPQVIDRIVDGDTPLSIGADERDITVMVTDIESFSDLVAETPLELFSTIINGYFDGVIDILWKYEAMIDKLTGDGLIVIFGAPVVSDDHAQRAIDCAREIDAFAEQYRVQVKAQHDVRFGATRMGVHSGLGLVGNFGGAKRFNYTAYGQTVVIAARLEAANKAQGTRILFSRETLRRAPGFEGHRSVGDLELKGVGGAVPSFTLA